MKKILFVLQEILKFGLIFLLSFIWLRYFIRLLWLCILLATTITIIITTIVYFLSKRYSSQKALKLSEKEDADNMFLSLITDQNSLDFFHNLAKSRHSNSEKKDDYIVITHKDKTKVILYPHLSLDSLTPNQLITIYNKLKFEKANKVVLTCFNYDKTTLLFAKNFEIDIVLLNCYETYARLYKEYDYYPEITIKYKKEAGLTFKALLAYSFNKSRTKGYVLSSIILFIMSFFVRINIYYLVVASLLLIFALISYINPKYNSKSGGNII